MSFRIKDKTVYLSLMSIVTLIFQSRRNSLGAAIFVKIADLKKPVSIGSTITIPQKIPYRQAFLRNFKSYFIE